MSVPANFRHRPCHNNCHNNYYNSFQARFCHDLNRDKNGNGVIDYLPDDPEKNEFEWYLPSTYQAFGILTSAGTIIYDAPNALALERNATPILCS